MATRTSPRRKIRSPYSGNLFNCPRGCDCPDCRIRLSRSAAQTVAWIMATAGLAVAIYLAISAIRGGQ
jgi:hypothetical protein